MMRVDWMSRLRKLELKIKWRIYGENDIRACLIGCWRVSYYNLENEIVMV